MFTACRSCGARNLLTVLDLGMQPAAGHYPGISELTSADPRWPLRSGVCTTCWLMQLQDDGPEEIDMAGAPAPTSSATMSAHARNFVADLVQRDLARAGVRILECASHGGYLQPFFRATGIDTTVVEPDRERAARFAAAGGRVVCEQLTSLGRSSPAYGNGSAGSWDLIVDHYLLAHLADPEAAIRALAQLLAPRGSIVIEFDHLLPTLEGRQFDAIRHGHHSYLSLTWLAAALARHGLEATDARPQAAYGGALRVEARRAAGTGIPARSVASVLADESAAGLGSAEAYQRFADDVQRARGDALAYLRSRVASGARVLAYGAPARATTLLNWYGIGPELIEFAADASPVKQGRCIPGVRIPIRSPGELLAALPDEVLILAWDLVDEIAEFLRPIRERGGRLLVPVPRLAILDRDGARLPVSPEVSRDEWRPASL